MPVYTRQYGTNISGITAIRLIDKSIITSQTTYNNASPIASPLAITDINKIYSFMQLGGSGSLSYSQTVTDAGIFYEYKLSWSYARNRIEIMDLLQAIKDSFFVIAIADANGKFMLLGSPTAPFEVTASFTASNGSYQLEAKGQCLIPPQFITGIFNPQLYTGGTGTV
jgi:hypothetical protein